MANYLREKNVDVGVMKPFASGYKATADSVSEDVEILMKYSQTHDSIDLVNPYYFEIPTSPYDACKQLNLEIDISKVLDSYKQLVSIGYVVKTTNQRKEGEEWTDARGRSWKLQDGKKKQITKVPPRGFDKCNGWEESDCDKLILKTIDQQTYNRMGR